MTASLRDQRHAEQGFNAFLEQDRIEHVLVVDMGEEDRSALGGDATGEAAADGDAHALLDLFFDSDGGARDELVARFVEEQDGAGVDGEDRVDPSEQLGEQLLQLEMRERHVGDRLDPLEPMPRVPLSLEQVGVVDRHRCSLAREAEELDIRVIELAMNERADVKHADDPVAHDQRHAEEGLDAFLEQDRVEHVVVVDVGEEDRSALGCDASGEAAADGDAHALLDLFLDSDGGARDELVGGLVEQQDGAGVDVEDRVDPLEQLGEQLFELEMRERCVGDGLEARQVVPLDGRPHAYRVSRSPRTAPSRM